MTEISIIIPLYKVEKYIKRCLQSIVCQTFTNYEVILVDDFSQDNSLKIAEHFLQENEISFQTIVHTKNQKQGTARNNGLKIAKGKYIYFIDADDELATKNALQLLYTEIEKDDYDFVTAREQHIENKKEKIIVKESNTTIVLKETEIIKALSKNKISSVVWNKLIRKKKLLKNNIFFFENTYFEDIPYCFILCNEAKKIALLNQVTYKYYFQENSNATTSILSKEKIKDTVNMCNELLLYADKNKVQKKIDSSLIHQTISLSILYVLMHPSLTLDRKKWRDTYTLFQEMYRGSFLRKYIKKPPFFPWLAYLINKSNNRFVRKLFIKIFTVLSIYNLRGKKMIIKKIIQKLC